MQGNYQQENNFKLITNSNFKSSKIIQLIYQIFLWFFIIFTLFNQNLFPILFLIYCLYLIIEFTSYTSIFLLNKKSTNSIYNKLKEIFSTSPELKLTCECYHFEKALEERKDKDGKVITVEVERKNTTYRGSECFQYYSFRDISGLFKIDLNSDILKYKNYIKLYLDTIISFPDSILIMIIKILKIM